MGRKKGSLNKKKVEFENLSDEFKDAVAQSSTDEIRKRIAEVTLLGLSERQLLKDDAEVSSAKEGLKNLMQPYRDNFKSYKEQVDYCKFILDNKGGGATVTQPSKGPAGSVKLGK